MIATAILLPIAEKVGATVVKALLAKAGVKGFDGAVDAIVGTVAEQAGLKPEALPEATPGQLEAAIVKTEQIAVSDPAIMQAFVDSQRLSVDLQRAEMTAEPAWTWAWRPAWMWMLALIWLYAFLLRPIANATTGASIEAVDLSMLMTLTGAYLALYMGGHTIKDAVGKVAGK